jgi:DNA (cytosine-5)-methyltransferase 1
MAEPNGTMLYGNYTIRYMKKIKINHLDLFSGIGGFHLGFERAGFEVNSYFSEIDKYAIQVYKDKFKDSNYVGSVTDVRGGDLPDIDLITFGSPCQDFSLAGKRKGLGGERSSLISEAIRLIREKRPRVFVWENVKGTFSSNNRQDFAAILQAFANIGGYRLEWQLLNTKWFLPQNRERIYLVGYLRDGSGGQIFPIGESFGKDDNEISLFGDTNKGGERGVIYNTEGIVGSLTATDYKQPKQIKVNSATLKGYEVAEEGDSINYSVPTSKTRRGRVGKGVAQTLDTACNQAVMESTKIRRLTPIECERLQGFPDDWTKEGAEGVISDTQRYKMCGNAVTVDVVTAVAKRIKKVVYA